MTIRCCYNGFFTIHSIKRARHPLEFIYGFDSCSYSMSFLVSGLATAYSFPSISFVITRLGVDTALGEEKENIAGSTYSASSFFFICRWDTLMSIDSYFSLWLSDIIRWSLFFGGVSLCSDPSFFLVLSISMFIGTFTGCLGVTFDAVKINLRVV